MAITPSDFSKIWASNADTPEYTFTEANYLKGWDFVGNLPPTRAMWNAMQKSTDEKMKYVFDNFGAPLTASTVAEMTMQNRVYVYTGSETGYTAGHWYYWNGSAWTDGGVYNSNTVQVDPTLTISGAAADAEVVGDMLTRIDTDIYVHTAKTASATASNWALNGTGICKTFTGVNLVKYPVVAGERLYLKLAKDWAYDSNSNGVYQWQSAASVPASGTNSNLVGTPVTNAVDTIVTAPTGATYLIVSQSNTNTTNVVEQVSATDTTLSVFGKSADAKVTGDKITRMQDELGLTDPASVTYNLNNSTIGTATAKLLIDAEEGETLTYKVSGSVFSSQDTVYFYLIDTNGSAYNVATINVNTQYSMTLPYEIIGVAIYKTGTYTGTVKIEAQRILANNITAKVEKNTEAITETEEDLTCVLNYNFTRNKKLSKDTPSVEVDTDNFCVSDYIAISDNSITTFYVGNGNETRVIALYDENKTQFSWKGVDSNTYYRSLSVSELSGASYVRMTFAKNYEAKVVNADGVVLYQVFEEDNEVPDYYEPHILNKAARINELAETCAATGDVFAFITDEHWTLNEKHSPALIKQLSKLCNIPMVISGGDTGDNPNKEFIQMLRDSFPHKIYHVVGNHEWFVKSADKITYAMNMYDNLEKVGNAEKQYWYVDNNLKKIRYIVLNRYRETAGGTWENALDDTDQLNWLENEALNVDSDWSVIIFCHWIEPANSTASVSARTIIDTAKNNGTDIIAIFVGHAHYDTVLHTEGGIPIVVTTCDKNAPWISEGVDKEPWLTSDRITGTVTEQAFDVVIVDRENRTIIAVRIGAKAMDNTDKIYTDQDFDFSGTLDERVIEY